MITKIYGPPGTGKTEKLIRRAMAYIRIGTPLNQIGYFAFTRKAANTAKQKPTELQTFDDLVLQMVSTLQTSSSKNNFYQKFNQN